MMNVEDDYDRAVRAVFARKAAEVALTDLLLHGAWSSLHDAATDRLDAATSAENAALAALDPAP
ncbi:MAG: hypothetical protein NVS3B16_24850 [Vulcanimicrobiaceae bacterium]